MISREQVERRSPGWWAYWITAKISAYLLRGAAPGTWVARRSLATREIEFGRSDIDLGLVLGPGQDKPENLCRLHRRFTTIRRFNPVLGGCLQLYRSEDFEDLWQWDTVFASLESRSLAHLCGPALPILGPAKCLVTDGRRRFLLWFEAFFTLLLQRRRPRELEKVALELWNYLALAQGHLETPLLRRSQMRRALTSMEGPQVVEALRKPDGTRVFGLRLAERLHHDLHAPLERLAQPLVFRAAIPPFAIERLVVLIPGPEVEPPPEYESPGALLATPELLNLFVHHRNSFSYLVLPQEVRDLGIEPPGRTARVQDLAYFSVHHFLFHPGFSPVCPHPEARLWVLEQELKTLQDGSSQPNFSGPEFERKAEWRVSVEEYYRTQYEAFGERGERIRRELRQFVDGQG